MGVGDVAGWAWLAFLSGCLLGYVVRDVLGDDPAADVLDRRVTNPYAHMLGRVMEVRKYEASDWEPCVVVAVGWHGSVCVRRICDLDRPGFWVQSDRARTHLREREVER